MLHMIRERVTSVLCHLTGIALPLEDKALRHSNPHSPQGSEVCHVPMAKALMPQITILLTDVSGELLVIPMSVGLHVILSKEIEEAKPPRITAKWKPATVLGHKCAAIL